MNCLTSRGYRFIDSGDRAEVYRRPNGMHYASVPRTKMIAVETARQILRQTGMGQDEINDFIKSALI